MKRSSLKEQSGRRASGCARGLTGPESPRLASLQAGFSVACTLRLSCARLLISGIESSVEVDL